MVVGRLSTIVDRQFFCHPAQNSNAVAVIDDNAGGG